MITAADTHLEHVSMAAGSKSRPDTTTGRQPTGRQKITISKSKSYPNANPTFCFLSFVRTPILWAYILLFIAGKFGRQQVCVRFDSTHLVDSKELVFHGYNFIVPNSGNRLCANRLFQTDDSRKVSFAHA